MFEMMLMGKMQIPPPDIRGEKVFNSSGVWICPPGVTNISFVIIAPGVSGTYSGSSASGGAGGGLRYRNSVPVVPGQSYSISIGGAGGQVSAFGTMVGSGATGSGPYTAAFSGTSGTTRNSQGSVLAESGKSGGYTKSQGANYLTGQIGANLYGGENISNGYGSGGYASKDGGGSGVAQTARPGACRIMWGRYRSFPTAAA